jgi:hypothetical protein
LPIVLVAMLLAGLIAAVNGVDRSGNLMLFGGIVLTSILLAAGIYSTIQAWRAVAHAARSGRHRCRAK